MWKADNDSTRLTEYLDKNKILIDQQSGFRKQRQTTENVVFLTQKFLEGFNKNKKVCAIYFDISKAFDKVWHNGLIYKLVANKVPFYILSWIKYFISGRSFCVKVNNEKSTYYQIYSGVPQFYLVF